MILVDVGLERWRKLRVMIEFIIHGEIKSQGYRVEVLVNNGSFVYVCVSCWSMKMEWIRRFDEDCWDFNLPIILILIIAPTWIYFIALYVEHILN